MDDSTFSFTDFNCPLTVFGIRSLLGFQEIPKQLPQLRLLNFCPSVSLLWLFSCWFSFFFKGKYKLCKFIKNKRLFIITIQYYFARFLHVRSPG